MFKVGDKIRYIKKVHDDIIYSVFCFSHDKIYEVKEVHKHFIKIDDIYFWFQAKDFERVDNIIYLKDVLLEDLKIK